MEKEASKPAKYSFSQFSELNLLNEQAIVYAARKGIAASVFYHLAETINMSEKGLASIINLSARTLSNYKESKKNLEPIYAEHLLKLVLLFEQGQSIFGSMDEFNQWLKKTSWNRTEKPIDLLTTPGGVNLVSQEISQLAQGYPA